MDTTDFKSLCEFAYERAGFDIAEGKEYHVESRLRPVLRELGLESFGEMVREIDRRPYADVGRLVIEALSVNETSFMRDRKPFEAIRDAILPAILEARASVRSLRIWSAACSTGQEAYSLLIMMRESFPELHDWRVQLIASDINEVVAARARKGVYNDAEMNRGLTPELRAKYFEREGDQWRVCAELRNAVDVRVVNLHDDWQRVMPLFDVVLIRNVLIYFDVAARRRILGRVYDRLQPDGALMLGSSETVLGVHDGFVAREHGGARYYSRRAESETAGVKSAFSR